MEGDILGDRRPESQGLDLPLPALGPGRIMGCSQLPSFFSKRRQRWGPSLPAQCLGQKKHVCVTVVRSSGCPLVGVGEGGEAVPLCRGGSHTSAPGRRGWDTAVTRPEAGASPAPSPVLMTLSSARPAAGAPRPLVPVGRSWATSWENKRRLIIINS